MSQFIFEEEIIEFQDGETVLESLIRSGKEVSHGCKAGACQACLLRTDGSRSAQSLKGLDDSTIDAGGFLSCQEKSSNDLRITRFDERFFPTYQAQLIEKEMLSHDVLRVSFEVPGFGLYPGRFIQLEDTSGLKRPYSIATSAFEVEPLVELHVRILDDGLMSRSLMQASQGDMFQVRGPFGKCYYRDEDLDRPILLIGSGTGLAPLFAVLTDALSRGHRGSLSLYLGSADISGLYFRDELNDLAERFEQVSIFLCADSGEDIQIRKGSPIDQALCDLGDLDGYLVYLCGHPQLVKVAQKRCFLAGASMKDIYADSFEASC